MTIRVSDEVLNKLLIAIEMCGFFKVAYTNVDKIHNCLQELKARREADRHDPMSQALNEGDGSYRP